MQDYGVKQAPKKKDISETKSSLAPQLLELMKMLFNVETYRCIIASFLYVMLGKNFFCSFYYNKPFFSRAAMTEFEINMSEMPLGKLSKENIQKGVLISFHVDLIFYIFQIYDDMKMFTLMICRIRSIN